MTQLAIQYDTKPWYRQFWPWFLFALPATVVVAAVATLIIASTGADDLVAADYYKEGLAINQRLEKEGLAQSLGLAGTPQLQGEQLHFQLTGPSDSAYLNVRLSHPLEADRDIELQLRRVKPGVYSAPLPALITGRWHWSVEPVGSEKWRLNGVIENREHNLESGSE